MNSFDEGQMAPESFLYGCVLESGKEVVFNPDNDDFEHQLDLRMACVDPTTKDELHVVEVEGQDAEGEKVSAVLASLKPSTLPTVALGGFTITPPVAFRLKTGSGPIYLCGHHLVMLESDSSLDEDEDDDEEEEGLEVIPSKKRPAASPAPKSQKKMKMEVKDEGDEEEMDEEEGTPVKAKSKAGGKAKPKPTQNGKSPKAGTLATKKVGAPKGKSPKKANVKETYTLPELQTKIAEAIKKGVNLPKAQQKFENYVKHSYRVSDEKIVADLWKWKQSEADPKK
ncbi:nucleophosmin 1a isoform X2 [Stigmatopora argus]